MKVTLKEQGLPNPLNNQTVRNKNVCQQVYLYSKVISKKSCCCACSCIFLQLFFCTQASEECCAAASYINCLFLKPPFLTCTLPSHSVAPFDRWWARLLALYICTHFGCLQALFGKSLLPLQGYKESLVQVFKLRQKL